MANRILSCGSPMLFALLASLAVFACAAEEDEVSGDDQNMNARRNPADGGGRDGEGGAREASAGSLSAGPAFAPKEIVVLADEDSEGEPRARIIASTQAGLCDRLREGLVLEPGEKILAVWASGANFSAGETALTPTAQAAKTAGASFTDANMVCAEAGVQEHERGSGSVVITSVGATVIGSLDVRFPAAHVTGTFEAKPCQAKTYGAFFCHP
jgi:hypothetical protein